MRIEKLANDVKRKRVEDGLSYRQLGIRLGISYNTIRRVEMNYPITVQVFEVLCGYIGTDPRRYLELYSNAIQKA